MGDCPICAGRGMVADHFTSRMVPTTESQPPLKSKRCPHCHGTGWSPQTAERVTREMRARTMGDIDVTDEMLEAGEREAQRQSWAHVDIPGPHELDYEAIYRAMRALDPAADEPATSAETDPCPPDDRIARMLAELDNSGEDWRRTAADSLEHVAATLRRGYDKAACETLERCLLQIRGYQTAKTLRERLGAIAEGGSK